MYIYSYSDSFHLMRSNEKISNKFKQMKYFKHACIQFAQITVAPNDFYYVRCIFVSLRAA